MADLLCGIRHASRQKFRGAFHRIKKFTGGNCGRTGNASSVGVGFDASICNNVYGNSKTVQPQSTLLLYLIFTGVETWPKE